MKRFLWALLHTFDSAPRIHGKGWGPNGIIRQSDGRAIGVSGGMFGQSTIFGPTDGTVKTAAEQSIANKHWQIVRAENERLGFK